MPTEVKNYPEGASPYGVLDMAGNVEELVADWYQEDYYSESPKENPQGPTYGEYHVVRGGSWELPYLFARSNVRFYSSVDTITPAMGFRCVLEGNSLP